MNPVEANALKNAVSDGYGRTTMQVIEKLPNWLRNKISGKEEQFLSDSSSIISLRDGYWYAKGKEPMVDWTR